MKVKIGNKVYDATDQPILIILNQLDKQNISNMSKEATKYCCAPDSITKQEVELFIYEKNIILENSVTDKVDSENYVNDLDYWARR